MGRGSSDSCFPSALSQLQSASCNRAQRIRGAEQQSGAQRSAGAKIPPIRRSSQFVLPYPQWSSGVTGLLVHYVQIRSQRGTSCRHLGVIMPFPHCFLSFHPNPAPPTDCCSLYFLCVGSAPLACSGSKPPTPPPPSPPVI